MRLPATLPRSRLFRLALLWILGWHGHAVADLVQGKDLRIPAGFTKVTKPWIARAGTVRELLGQLRTALLEMRGPAAFKALKKDGFLPVDNGDYDPVRQAIGRNGRIIGG